MYSAIPVVYLLDSLFYCPLPVCVYHSVYFNLLFLWCTYTFILMSYSCNVFIIVFILLSFSCPMFIILFILLCCSCGVFIICLFYSDVPVVCLSYVYFTLMFLWCVYHCVYFTVPFLWYVFIIVFILPCCSCGMFITVLILLFFFCGAFIINICLFHSHFLWFFFTMFILYCCFCFVGASNCC